MDIHATLTLASATAELHTKGENTCCDRCKRL